MANVNVEGHGSYTVPPEKVSELLQWLTDNAAQLEQKQQPTDGNTLLNEKNPNVKNPNDNRDPMDPNSEGRQYDFGTTWM